MTGIFQTIWASLTTENEFLAKLICIPLAFLEAFISLLLFTAIFNIKINNNRKIYYILIISIVGTITNIFVSSPFNTFINIIVFFLCNMFILGTNIFETFLSILIPFIMTIVLELILSNLYNTFFGSNYSAVNKIPIYRLCFSLIVYFIEYLIYVFIKKFKIKFSKIQILDKKRKILLILTIILAILLIAGQLYILTFYSYTMPLFISILNIIGLIAYFALNLYSIFTESKLEQTSMSLEESKLYNKTLEILQDNTRAFRHDSANILQGMVGYMDNNDMEGLKKYYSQFVDDFSHSNNLATLSPKVVNNPAIYSVLASKYHKADELGIKITLESFLDMNELHIKIYEFTRVLGILMDNAIEASKECDEKLINVIFRKDNKRHMQLLIVENTYKDKQIDTEKIYEKGYSTKKGNTGLGLWEIRQILKKNDNLNLYTTKNDKFFRQQFEIYY